MKYNITNLAIEVTRKCNMNCDHCLRGDAQNINIEPQYIYSLLQNVQSIGSILFTGGEPSLNIQAMDDTLAICKELDISVGSFYIVTNGLDNAMELAISCLQWYAYCDDYDEISGLSISKDMFHEHISNENERIFRGLSFFREDKTTDFNRVKLIDSGRASNLTGFDMIDVDLHDEELNIQFYHWDDENEPTIESMIYLSANGEIRTNCDAAYNDTRYTIGNISNDSFDHIIQQNMQKDQLLLCS